MKQALIVFIVHFLNGRIIMAKGGCPFAQKGHSRTPEAFSIPLVHPARITKTFQRHFPELAGRRQRVPAVRLRGNRDAFGSKEVRAMSKVLRVVLIVICGIVGGWAGYWTGHAAGWSVNAEWPLRIGGGTGAILLSIGLSVLGVVLAWALLPRRR
jgi:hypothetical protein